MSLPRQLHAASLPFVTRALRGAHRTRYAALALLLCVLSVVLGAWVALGSGRLEHELRVDLNLEQPMHVQEDLQFKLFAEDEHDARALQRALREQRTALGLARIAAGEYHVEDDAEMRVSMRLNQALNLLAGVGEARDLLPPEVHTQAHALLARFQLDSIHMDTSWYGYDNAERELQIRTIIARELHPEIVVYSSPLTARDAIQLTGLIAGGLTLLLLMLFAPVLAGTQMAQEVHENTLQPLTGTALSARELVLGLSLGPAAVVALLAAPQVVLFLAAALAVGHVVPALALLVVGLTGAAFLTMLAQLAGLALGRQRAPGVLGVALLAMFAPLSLLGFALALELPHHGIGALALLPHGAASHMLLETFIPAGTAARSPWLSPASIADAQISVAIGAAAMLCFAFLGLRALERRVGELSPTALNRPEALLGALVSVALVTLANPYRDGMYNATEFYLGNLVFVCVPLAILLMMRVPLGDGPVALRRVPVGSLVAEFAVAVALYFAVTVACMGGLEPMGLLRSPVALAYLAWTLGVAALLTIRVAALPMTLLAKLWAGVCTVGLGVAFIHAMEWSRHVDRPLTQVFGLWQVSPLLGVLQIALLLLIPALLLRTLRNPGAAAPTAD